MIPIDDAVDKDPSTGVRRITNPAAGSAPVTRRAAPGVSQGGRDPAVSAPGSRGKTPPLHERDADAGPVPGTGASLSPFVEPTPVRGRATQASAGAGTDRPVRETESTVPAGLQGAEWRKQVKAATSALHATQRRKATRYVRKADRGAGAQYRPGMGRRMPPSPPESDGVA